MAIFCKPNGIHGIVASMNAIQPFLTAQEQRFCQCIAQGLALEVAAKETGMTKLEAAELLARDTIQDMLAVLKNKVDEYMQIEVTNDLLNAMLFEAHATAATSTEKISAVRELGKMNGLYAPEKKEIDITTNKKMAQLESMTDEELVKRANYQLDLRNPKTITDVPTDE